MTNDRSTTTKQNKFMNPIVRNILIIAFIVLAVLSVYYLQEVFIYLGIAAVVSLLGRPIMHFFEELKIGNFTLPTSVSAFLTIFIFYAVLALFVLAFVPLIIEQAKLILSIDINTAISSLDQPIEQADALMHKYSLMDPDIHLRDQLTTYLKGFFNFERLQGVFGSVFGFLGNILALLIATFSVTFITFFFLTDKQLLYNMAYSLVPQQWEKGYDKVVNQSKTLLTRYIFGIIVQIVVVAIYVTLAMNIIGIENALLIGVFAGLVNIIPYVGPVLALAFAVFVAITTNLEMDFYTQMVPMLIKVAVALLSMQMLDNLLLQPFIFSNSVKAHPLEIFILILVAGTLFGVLGMVLAIPVYTIFRVVAKEFLSEFKVIKSLTQNI